MKTIKYILATIFLSLVSDSAILQAQGPCDIDTAQVIEVVGDVCSDIGENQVCYGNFEVGVDLLASVLQGNLNFTFKNPGDLADLSHIESLYLSTLRPEENTWGIAQMRLVTSAAEGAKELNLLLFGDVKIENAVAITRIIEVKVSGAPTSIRNLPSNYAIAVQSVDVGTTLEAVGRLENNSWLRVRTEKGGVGWILSDFMIAAHEGESIADLAVQDSASPYFGPMQAFSFEQGEDSSNCNNLVSDGLLVQTPQGTARVNVSINGVNIDLLPGQTGTTALIQSDENSAMTISMLEGESIIAAAGLSYNLKPGEATNIAISDRHIPIAPPSFPSTYNPQTVSNLPILPLVTTADHLSLATIGGSRNTTSGNTSVSGGNNNITSSGNNDTTNGNTSVGGGNNNATGDSGNTSVSGSNNDTTDRNTPVGATSNNTTTTATEPEDYSNSLRNIIAATLAIIATIALVGGTVAMARMDKE
jgi:hypothetical protein